VDEPGPLGRPVARPQAGAVLAVVGAEEEAVPERDQILGERARGADPKVADQVGSGRRSVAAPKLRAVDPVLCHEEEQPEARNPSAQTVQRERRRGEAGGGGDGAAAHPELGPVERVVGDEEVGMVADPEVRGIRRTLERAGVGQPVGAGGGAVRAPELTAEFPVIGGEEDDARPARRSPWAKSSPARRWDRCPPPDAARRAPPPSRAEPAGGIQEGSRNDGASRPPEGWSLKYHGEPVPPGPPRPTSQLGATGPLPLGGGGESLIRHPETACDREKGRNLDDSKNVPLRLRRPVDPRLPGRAREAPPPPVRRISAPRRRRPPAGRPATTTASGCSATSRPVRAAATAAASRPADPSRSAAPAPRLRLDSCS